MIKLNPNEAPFGYLADLPGRAKNSCYGCAFNGDHGEQAAWQMVECRKARCSAKDRVDGCTVIFVSAEGKGVLS